MASLRTATAADVAAAMAPDAPAEQRQEVFARWAAGAVGPLTQHQLDQLLALAPEIRTLLGSVGGASLAQALPNEDDPPGEPEYLPSSQTVVEGLAGGRMRITFDPQVAAGLTPGQEVVTLEILPDDPLGGGGETTSLVEDGGIVAEGPKRLGIWRGTVAQDPAGPTFAEVARQAIYVPEAGSSLAGAPFENFLDGILLFVDPATGRVFDSWWSASDRFETVDVVPLQDATARRAILIPAQVLGDERHRLRLVINRARWTTTEAADDLNHYRDSETLIFDV